MQRIVNAALIQEVSTYNSVLQAYAEGAKKAKEQYNDELFYFYMQEVLHALKKQEETCNTILFGHYENREVEQYV